MTVRITSKVVLKKSAAKSPEVPVKPKINGSNLLCSLYAEGKLTKPTTTTKTNSIGCINSSDVFKKLTEPIPPQTNIANKRQ